MARKPRASTIYLVVQEGGSTGEYYPTLYNSEPAARRAIAGHQRASYNAYGPIAVRVDKYGDVAVISELALLDVVTDVLKAVY
jgi:hypothetical protein